MKKINTFIIATSIVALLSCSKTNVPSLEDDALLDEQTRSEATADAENENYGVTGIAVIPREEVEIDPIHISPDEKPKNDTIPCDTIPADTIPFDSIPKDRIGKGSFGNR